MRYALTEQFEALLGRPIPERGKNVMVFCPFHQHNFDTPSLSINLETGLWMCFACPEKGSIFRMANLLQKNLSGDVVLHHARNLAYHEDEPDPDFTEKADQMHMRMLVEKPLALINYVYDRNLSSKILRRFRLGWDGKRISMPYYDEDAVRGIKYRYPDGFKVYETGSKRFLYNVNEVRDRTNVILCEGESDTHKMWSYLDSLGNPWNTVGVAGVPGTNVTRSTWELWAFDMMQAQRVFIALDADDAGDEWSQEPMKLFGSRAVRVRPTKGKDITEHIMNGGTLDEAGMDEHDILARAVA